MLKSRVLVIDDEQEVHWFLRRVLENEGFEVATEEDSMSGFRVAATEPVDLLILDILLADQSGFDALVQFRAEFPDLPIVVLTGLPLDDNFVDSVHSLGGNACLPKTHPLGELLKVVRHFAFQNSSNYSVPILLEREEPQALAC